MLAITHVPSPKMADCELTFVSRSAIDYERALNQHAAYSHMLRECGAEVRTLDVNLEMPDCAFVEDLAIVLDEVAILARMGAPSRRAETDGIESELRRLREVRKMPPDATLEGGDVLQIGRTLLVGLSSRTNTAGAKALAAIVGDYGYSVRAISVRGCLHLKTACTALPDNRLLVNPAWLGEKELDDFELVHIPPAEPWGANIAIVNGRICASAAHGETCQSIRRLGFEVHTVELDEFAKAEGGVTCLSILANFA